MKIHTFKTWTGKRRRYFIHIQDILYGRCEVPDKPGDRVKYNIDITTKQTPRQAIDSAIHEAIHAVDPDATEAYVVHLSAETTRFLWRYLNARDMLK